MTKESIIKRINEIDVERIELIGRLKQIQESEVATAQEAKITEAPKEQ